MDTECNPTQLEFDALVVGRFDGVRIDWQGSPMRREADSQGAMTMRRYKRFSRRRSIVDRRKRRTGACEAWLMSCVCHETSSIVFGVPSV